MYVPIILGTAREGRQSEKAANFILQQAHQAEFDTEILDVRDYRLPSTYNFKKSPQAKKLMPKIKKSSGLIIVSPEYNHSYPGELKMMLDLLYKEYFGKPVGICGVSSGPNGGVRMVQQLRLVCIALGMKPISSAVYFRNVNELFDDSGQILDQNYLPQVQKFLEDLKYYAKKLK